MRVTLNRINAYLQRVPGMKGVELVRGTSYFYFTGGDTWRWYSTSVLTTHLNNMTIEEWVNEAKNLRSLGLTMGL